MEANTIEKYKILIVDDSDFSRSTISAMLDDPRYVIIGEASSAKEATTIVNDRTIHLAIIDIVMPEISGIELADYISSHFPEIQIIMISSLAHETIIIDAISAGASDFLQKPIEKNNLIVSVEKALHNIEVAI